MSQLLVLCLLMPLAATASSETSDMRGAYVRGGFDYGDYTRLFRASGDFSASHWVSFWVPVSDGACGKPEVLKVIGLPPGSIDDKIAAFMSERDCRDSKDGSGVASGISHALYGRMMSFDRSFRNLDNVGKQAGRLRRQIAELVEPGSAFSAESLDTLAEGCRGQCYAIQILARLFARANSADARGDSAAADQWRFVALSVVKRSSWFRENFHEALAHAVYRAYQRSVEQNTLGLAASVIGMLDDFALEGESPEKIRTHFTQWQATRASSKAPLIQRVSLSGDNPYSDKHGVSQVFLERRDFRLAGDVEQVDVALLRCRAPSGGERTVTLQLAAGDRWQSPEDWSSCQLLLLGEASAALEVWQFPTL